jgi:hypothetical protein
MLLALSGCQWLSTGPTDQDGDLTPSQRDSLGIYLRHHRQLARENERLKILTASQELDLAKLRAECQHHTELNELLVEELEQLKDDLDQVENQFVIIEKRLQLTETKASAVAAIAEVQLLFDKLRTKDPDGLDSVTVAEVRSKIKTSDELTKKRNYAAAVYFSNRAMRILNQTERLKNIALSLGIPRIISVSKANVRDGPGSSFKVVEKLAFGTVIVQLEVENEWCKIRTESGKSGWIHSSLIR